MAKQRFLIGFEISGHLLVEAANAQAAAAVAIGLANSAAADLQEHGEVERRVPYGRVINVGALTPAKKHRPTKPAPVVKRTISG